MQTYGTDMYYVLYLSGSSQNATYRKYSRIVMHQNHSPLWSSQLYSKLIRRDNLNFKNTDNAKKYMGDLGVIV
jgi:hypothetical protein